MGYRPLRTLGDYIRHGYWLQVDCFCGHVAQLDPLVLADRLSLTGRSLVVEKVVRHLRCSACGRTGPNHMTCNAPDEQP